MSNLTTKTCGHCGREFQKDPRNSMGYWAKAKYCCQRCFGDAWSERAKAKRPAMADKFAEQVKKGDGCWEWTGCRDKDGYGLFPYAKTQHRAPRMALVLAGQPAPEGMFALHTCDNPICVRPDHLYWGTHEQNMRDAVQRKRLNSGKKLTLEQAREIKTAIGKHREIAERYGVTASNVTMIRTGRIWRNA